MWQHLAFFVLDGIALWITLSIAAILILVSVEYERPGWCTLLILLTLAILEFYTDWNPVGLAIQYPVLAITIIAAYFAIGTVWVVLKWWSHVYLVQRQFNKIKDVCRKEVDSAYVKADGSLSDAGLEQFYSKAARRLGERQLPLQVGQHKAELYMWWTVWPLSMIWTIINDPVKRLWYFVYDQIRGLLQRISDSAFKVD